MRTRDWERMGMIEIVENRCKYFTGTIKDVCDKGVAYRKGSYIPCFRRSNYSGEECEFAEFPTREEAKAEVEQMAGQRKY